MNNGNFRIQRRFGAAARTLVHVLVLAALAACSKEKDFQVPPLNDEPVTATVEYGDLTDYAPVSGIVLGQGEHALFEVNVETEDAPRVHLGASATAFVGSSREGIPCRVARVVKNVSRETGQSVAWLKPSVSRPFLDGDFVQAKIATVSRHHVLTIPEEAVLMKSGQTYAIVRSGSSYRPVEIATGLSSENRREVSSGLKASDQVVVQGGIGFLYPDFKALQSEGD